MIKNTNDALMRLNLYNNIRIRLYDHSSVSNFAWDFA